MEQVEARGSSSKSSQPDWQDPKPAPSDPRAYSAASSSLTELDLISIHTLFQSGPTAMLDSGVQGGVESTSYSPATSCIPVGWEEGSPALLAEGACLPEESPGLMKQPVRKGASL